MLVHSLGPYLPWGWAAGEATPCVYFWAQRGPGHRDGHLKMLVLPTLTAGVWEWPFSGPGSLGLSLEGAHSLCREFPVPGMTELLLWVHTFEAS